ncbi:MAG: thiol peroxidase [Ktedonobacteraceae bacterium]
MEERIGEAFELGEHLTIIGRKLHTGEQAPNFTLDYLDPKDSAIRQVQLVDTAGTVRLLNVVNSLDTPVCHVETHHWETLRATLPANVHIYTVSMDLPFALARWQTAEGVEHAALSAHRNEQFGRDYGVLIKEWRLLQRAVFVIDQHDHIVHAEYVADQMLEPNYNAALEVVRRVASR